MTVENLEWNNKRFRNKVRIDSSMEDVNTAVIGCGAEQRMRAVELERANSFAVVPQSLVGPVRQIQVVPNNTLVVASNEHVVA